MTSSRLHLTYWTFNNKRFHWRTLTVQLTHWSVQTKRFDWWILPVYSWRIGRSTPNDLIDEFFPSTVDALDGPHQTIWWMNSSRLQLTHWTFNNKRFEWRTLTLQLTYWTFHSKRFDWWILPVYIWRTGLSITNDLSDELLLYSWRTGLSIANDLIDEFFPSTFDALDCRHQTIWLMNSYSIVDALDFP